MPISLMIDTLADVSNYKECFGVAESIAFLLAFVTQSPRSRCYNY